MRGIKVLYDFEGKKLTKTEIARIIGVSDVSLSNYLKKTNDNINDAIKLAIIGRDKKRGELYEYNGEFLNIPSIAKKEGITPATLKKYILKTKNIYEAVNIAKKASESHQVIIEYSGEKTTITALAKKNNINSDSLRLAYEQTGDVSKAIKLSEERKNLRNNYIEYNGESLSFTEIARRENVAVNTLKRYYSSFGNIYKAVLVSKKTTRKKKNVVIDNIEISIENLANNFNTSTQKIEKIIDNGISSLDKIDEEINHNNSNIILINSISLRKFCFQNSYNYSVILYLIKNHGLTPEKAVEEYIKNGQKLPIHYIYEKYGILFRHLMLKYNIDCYDIIAIMKKNNCLLDKAVEEYIFKKDNDEYNLTYANIEWLKEVYDIIKNSSKEDYEKIKKENFVSDKEEEFLIDKDKKIRFVNRQLLLFEFSEVIKIWPLEELLSMMDLYNITEEEKRVIVLDLYSPFKNGVINPNAEYNDRQNEIKKAVLDDTFIIEGLTENEKKIIEVKRNILSSIIKERKNDDETLLK